MVKMINITVHQNEHSEKETPQMNNPSRKWTGIIFNRLCYETLRDSIDI
jgi:hypothetical protein